MYESEIRLQCRQCGAVQEDNLPHQPDHTVRQADVDAVLANKSGVQVGWCACGAGKTVTAGFGYFGRDRRLELMPRHMHVRASAPEALAVRGEQDRDLYFAVCDCEHVFVTRNHWNSLYRDWAIADAAEVGDGGALGFRCKNCSGQPVLRRLEVEWDLLRWHLRTLVDGRFMVKLPLNDVLGLSPDELRWAVLLSYDHGSVPGAAELTELGDRLLPAMPPTGAPAMRRVPRRP